MELLDLLANFNTSIFSDRWIRDAGGDDQFSVSFARRVIDDNYLSGGVTTTRWNKYLPQKVNIFLLTLLSKQVSNQA